MMHTRSLHRLSTNQIRERLDKHSVVIQPMGAIEAHGPHLPVTTDFLVADRTAAAVCDEPDGDWWLLPTLAYGRSLEHQWAPGTVTFSTRTLLAVLEDVGRSVAATGAQRLVFLNAHGGNTALLEIVCRDLRLKHGLLTFVIHPFLPADHGGLSMEGERGLGVHGGADETSIMLHLEPDLVNMNLAAPGLPEWHEQNKYVRFGGSVGFGWLSNDFSESGIVGDPRLASADDGARLTGEMVTRMRHELEEIGRFSFGGPDRC